MNNWFKLALFSLIGIIVLNLFLSVMFRPGVYNTNTLNAPYYGMYNSKNYMPMHRGMMNKMMGDYEYYYYGKR